MMYVYYRVNGGYKGATATYEMMGMAWPGEQRVQNMRHLIVER